LKGVIVTNVLETERLTIRHFTRDDADFILELLNEPAFIQNIADRGVRTTDDALRYLENGPLNSYQKYGFGLYAVTLKESGVSIGMCGLIKRDSLEDVDIGYAILERFGAKGYATEAAAAVLAYGYNVLALKRIVAITAPDNDRSINVLQKIGLKFAGLVYLPHIGESKLFVP
jgi:[ribosomal protein S5]-alanine N-acetyltransferase